MNSTRKICFTNYYRNFILCGDVDFYCLLCDEVFNDIDDINKHIRWENHRKIIKIQTCLPPLKNDGIFKISSYYYCCFCNYVSYNYASIKEHIKTQKHSANKHAPEAISNRVNASYNDEDDVIIDNIKINEEYWIGIYNEQCLMCNVIVKDVWKHFDSPDHVIRLIQTEMKYEGDDKCYRKVNETTFQCFYCMRPFSSEDYENHWKYHKLDINGNFEHPIRVGTLEEYNKICKLEYAIENLANITDELFNIDLAKNKQLKCKQCNTVVRPSQTDLCSHMSKHNVYDPNKSNIVKKITEEINKRYFFIKNIPDNGKIKHELAVFGKENHIKLSAGSRRGYCLLCDRFLVPNISIFEEHAKGNAHKGYLELKGLIKAKKHKKGMGTVEGFLRYVVTLDYITDMDSVSVNCGLCVDKQSFLLLKRIKHGKHLRVTKCFVCEESFKWWKEKEHCETETHRSHFMNAKVLLADHNFIREIKPKLYHCGLCNITIPFWESLENHLKDRIHRSYMVDNNLVYALKTFAQSHGTLPEVRHIEIGGISNVLYSNILKVIFESRLGGLRIFTMDLTKLQQS